MVVLSKNWTSLGASVGILASAVMPSLGQGTGAGSEVSRGPTKASEKPQLVRADGWSQFRGPNAQGRISAASLPLEFDLNRQVAWRTELPAGASSPVIRSDGSIVVTGSRGQVLVTMAISPQDGAILWEKGVAVGQFQKSHPLNLPASSTPVTDGTRTFVYFPSYGLQAFDFKGTELWSRAAPAGTNRWGSASSPILCKRGLVLLEDVDSGASSLSVLDPTSGALIWKKDRSHAKSGWSTPVLRDTPTGEEIVVLGGKRLEGYSAATGALNWWLGGIPGDNITVPVVYGSNVIVSGLGFGSLDVPGEGFGSVLRWPQVIKFDANGDGHIQLAEIPADAGWDVRPEVARNMPGTFSPMAKDFPDMDTDHDNRISEKEWREWVDSFVDAEPKNRFLSVAVQKAGSLEASLNWETRKGLAEVPSPVLYGNRIYTIKDGGVLSCLDADSGAVVYQERLNAPGQYIASPIVATVAERTYVISVSTKGVISTIPVGDNFQLSSQANVGEEVFATPAIDTRLGRIYLRTGRGLIAFGSK